MVRVHSLDVVEPLTRNRVVVATQPVGWVKRCGAPRDPTSEPPPVRVSPFSSMMQDAAWNVGSRYA